MNNEDLFLFQKRLPTSSLETPPLTSFLPKILKKKLVDNPPGNQRKILKTTLNKLPAGVGLYRGPDFIIEIANPAYLKIASGRKVVGKLYKDVWPEAYEAVEPLLNRTLKTGKIYRAVDEKFELKNNKGMLETRYFTWSLIRIRLPGEKNWGILNTVIETTESKKAQLKLIEKEATLKSFYDSAPFMMGIMELINDKSVLISANKALGVFFGGLPKKMVGSQVAALGCPPEIESLWVKYFKKSQQQKKSLKFEYEYPKSGSKQWLQTTVSFISHSPSGNPRFSLVTENITPHKIMEEKIWENERQLQSIIDGTPALIFVKDLEGRFITINKSVEKKLGLTRKEIKGKTDFDLITKNLAEVYRENDRKIMKTGLPQQIEETAYMKDGKHILLAYKFPLYNAEGKIYAIAGISTDITKLRELEKRKDEFISVASHELKTPLTSIKAYVQILERMIKNMNYPQAELLIAKTNIYINKLHALISDLLDVSKIQAGKLQLNIRKFDLQKLIRQSIESVQLTSENHEIIFEGKVDQKIEGDRDRLEQVLVNLLSNAIKYSPNKNKVVVSVKKGIESVEISIKDFGVGIPSEKHKKLFTRFYRVDEDKTQFSGLGIGLYISSEIIKLHHGKIWLESKVDKGSTFYVSIPVKQKKKKMQF